MNKPQLQTIYLPIVKIEQNRTNIPLSSIPQEKWGVHRTHCCKRHGCKYGMVDCPVVLRNIEQDYECEDGSFLDESCFQIDNDDFQEESGYFFTPEQLNQLLSNVITDTLESAAEEAEVDFESYDKEFVNKESITNTFEKTYLKHKV